MPATGTLAYYKKFVNYERKKFYTTGSRSVGKAPDHLVNLPLGQTARKLFWNENKRGATTLSLMTISLTTLIILTLRPKIISLCNNKYD